MKCKACGAIIATSVCSYCRAVDFELAKQELETAKKERNIKAIKAKMIDYLLICLATFLIFLAFTGLIAITNPRSDNTLRTDLPMIIIVLIFATIPIIGVIVRKRNRRKKDQIKY